ncbi:hypothetical protein PV755_22480 [Streptomyces caniscabiei]|uniref:Uncharacterized protein n=1 Tax=Streptomyces caniscabiei TaxID=2746961 RepID=A0A927LCH3_9ACTN|nr:hypothetical protein [Streptomyces caniscabiei]MBD9726473.1 hypothetical protein [Streptomyces caniscabiei]MDX3511670.1 hypothetical protein [Streptomyces caniscabiei]MDX3719219.1 hypothetical protein [Streptomyces caniscabiei]WEO29636.1 hypothetical protein IHE65_44330 [Streptomyces caniscabiei]
MTTQNDDSTPTTTAADEPTMMLPDSVTLVEGIDDTVTQVPEHGGAGEPTQVLPTVGESAPTMHLGPAATVHLGPAPTMHLGPATTVHFGPVEDRVPAAETDAADAEDAPEYSATVLASHWIQRPETDDTLAEATLAEATLPEKTVEQPSAAAVNGSTPPDRIDGTLLRFGPGVTNVVAQRTHRTLPALPPTPVPRRRRLRRHALPVLVLLCVLAFLAWQRLGPPLEVDTVTVTARPTVLGCDSTADIVAVVATNGRPGTFSYRWIRSDGTRSGVLEEVVVRGQRQARVHLRWTFQGKGHRTARAELRILTADRHTAGTRFTYDCS